MEAAFKRLPCRCVIDRKKSFVEKRSFCGNLGYTFFYIYTSAPVTKEHPLISSTHFSCDFAVWEAKLTWPLHVANAFFLTRFNFIKSKTWSFATLGWLRWKDSIVCFSHHKIFGCKLASLARGVSLLHLIGRSVRSHVCPFGPVLKYSFSFRRVLVQTQQVFGL